MSMRIIHLRKTIVMVLAVAAGGMLLTSCLKSKDNPSQQPVAGLMAFNLTSDQPAVAVTLSGNTLTQQPLGYGNYTGVYLSIYPGDRTIQSYNYNSAKMLASGSFTFEQGKYYSAFVAGDSGSYRNVVVNDNLDSLAAVSGSGYIRYVNAIADTINKPLVTISAGGSNVVNENAAFAAVSAFRPVNAGDVSIAVKSSAGVDSSRTITVEQNKVYTVLLTGVPGTTDATKAVQIKYIVNGTITASGQN